MDRNTYHTGFLWNLNLLKARIIEPSTGKAHSSALIPAYLPQHTCQHTIPFNRIPGQTLREQKDQHPGLTNEEMEGCIARLHKALEITVPTIPPRSFENSYYRYPCPPLLSHSQDGAICRWKNWKTLKDHPAQLSQCTDGDIKPEGGWESCPSSHSSRVWISSDGQLSLPEQNECP